MEFFGNDTFRSCVSGRGQYLGNPDLGWRLSCCHSNDGRCIPSRPSPQCKRNWFVTLARQQTDTGELCLRSCLLLQHNGGCGGGSPSVPVRSWKVSSGILHGLSKSHQLWEGGVVHYSAMSLGQNLQLQHRATP